MQVFLHIKRFYVNLYMIMLKSNKPTNTIKIQEAWRTAT